VQVSIFNKFGLKMPIHDPNGVFFLGGGILPVNGSSHIATPKRHFLVQKHVIRRRDR